MNDLWIIVDVISAYVSQAITANYYNSHFYAWHGIIDADMHGRTLKVGGEWACMRIGLNFVTTDNIESTLTKRNKMTIDHMHSLHVTSGQVLICICTNLPTVLLAVLIHVPDHSPAWSFWIPGSCTVVSSQRVRRVVAKTELGRRNK